MAYQTLYRKYRPKSFKLVFGQNVIVKTLKNVIKTNKLCHAYLFTGPRGTGKTSCAKLFAKAINCLNNKDGDACNDCEQCNSFNKNSNPDIIEIDAASNNGVDEIREIKNKITLVPSVSKYKVYIIDEVHMLSIGAFNALLKTLEEPPEYVVFILATTEPQKLPATVISRCQRFDFKSISAMEMKQCLQNIVSKENINIEEEALDKIIEVSHGGMRDAISLLDQAYAFCDDKIILNDINELSGSISDDEIYSLANIIKTGNYKKMFEFSEKVFENGKDYYLICEKMIDVLRKNIINKKIKKDDDSHGVNNIFTERELYIISDELIKIMQDIENIYQKKVIFEIRLLQLIDKLNNKERFILNENYKKNDDFNEKNEIPIENKIIKKDFNVSRETLKLDNKKLLDELKNIRINNILKESTKTEINLITNSWKIIKNYLSDDNYKVCAGILMSSKPVAACENGIIITLPIKSMLERIESEYDNSKELIKNILNKEYKIVYVLEKKWQEIRPKYVEKAKNNELEIIDEQKYLEKIKNNNKFNSVDDFNDLIVLEEK